MYRRCPVARHNRSQMRCCFDTSLTAVGIGATNRGIVARGSLNPIASLIVVALSAAYSGRERDVC
jgi:hypothetical protein